jgi:hypothetical protein
VLPFLPLVADHGLLIDLAGGPTVVPLSGALWFHKDIKFVGVITGYCLLRAAFRGLKPPRRDQVRFDSGHPGSGMEDTFEYFTRAVSGHRYHNRNFTTGLRIPGAPGIFRWTVTVGIMVIEAALRPDVVPPVLFTPVPPGEEEARRALQLSVAAEMLAASDDALFERFPQGTP